MATGKGRFIVMSGESEVEMDEPPLILRNAYKFFATYLVALGQRYWSSRKRSWQNEAPPNETYSFRKAITSVSGGLIGNAYS